MSESLVTLLAAAFGGGMFSALAAWLIDRRRRKDAAEEREVQEPLNEAKAAKVLSDASAAIVERLQKEIDDLDEKLTTATQKIANLEGRLEEASKHAEELGRIRERLELTEAENERLKAKLPEREEDQP